MAAISKALSASELKNCAVTTVKNARRLADEIGAALSTTKYQKNVYGSTGPDAPAATSSADRLN